MRHCAVAGAPERVHEAGGSADRAESGVVRGGASRARRRRSAGTNIMHHVSYTHHASYIIYI